MEVEDLRHALLERRICNMQAKWSEHSTGVLDTGNGYVAFESMGTSLVKYETFPLWGDAVGCASGMARAYNAVYQGPIQWGDPPYIEWVK